MCYGVLFLFFVVFCVVICYYCFCVYMCCDVLLVVFVVCCVVIGCRCFGGFFVL